MLCRSTFCPSRKTTVPVAVVAATVANSVLLCRRIELPVKPVVPAEAAARVVVDEAATINNVPGTVAIS